MLIKGPARKVTVFVNEDARRGAMSLADAVLSYLLHQGVAGATATRAYAGFGVHHVLHTPDVEALGEHLPIRIEFVESPGKTEEVLPGLYEIVNDGLIEVQETTIVSAPRPHARPDPAAPRERRQGPALLMRVFLGEADQWHGEPLYDAIVTRLRMMEIAGATVYRGISGYGAKGHEHRRSFFHPVRDLPVMISVVDSPEKIRGAAEAIEGMLEDGLIVISEAEAIRLLRRGEPAEARDANR
jgi:PII-like signaling protein